MNEKEKFEPLIEQGSEKKEKILPKKIREALNELRKEELPFHKKAQKLASILSEEGCKNIEILDCDVCVEDFYPEFSEKLEEIYPKNFDELPEEEKEKIHQKMQELIPEEAKVRVHANTPAGYFTWCFGCESTMCGNEVEYPENPDWDKIHQEKAREILRSHPEWKISKFILSGSTRNRISIDVISDDPNLQSHFWNEGDFHISLHPYSSLILKHHPEIEKDFQPL